MVTMADVQHGTTYGYRKGCRCLPCREAKRKDWQDYKARQQVNPFEDFEGQEDEGNQVAGILEGLTLRVRCECGDWHEAAEDCPEGIG